MVENYYVIVDDKNRKLSGFYPNDLVGQQLRFRKNDWYSYSAKEGAQAHLDYIRRTCRHRKQVGQLRIVRWG